jgi:hypothetical protein
MLRWPRHMGLYSKGTIFVSICLDWALRGHVNLPYSPGWRDGCSKPCSGRRGICVCLCLDHETIAIEVFYSRFVTPIRRSRKSRSQQFEFLLHVETRTGTGLSFRYIP